MVLFSISVAFSCGPSCTSSTAPSTSTCATTWSGIWTSSGAWHRACSRSSASASPSICSTPPLLRRCPQSLSPLGLHPLCGRPLLPCRRSLAGVAVVCEGRWGVDMITMTDVAKTKCVQCTVTEVQPVHHDGSQGESAVPGGGGNTSGPSRFCCSNNPAVQCHGTPQKKFRTPQN